MTVTVTAATELAAATAIRERRPYRRPKKPLSILSSIMRICRKTRCCGSQDWSPKSLTKKIERIVIEGHADAAGGEALNQDLSVLRADAVRAYLTAHGVPRDLIFIRGFGETAPAQPAADGERNPANRRARIEVQFV